MNASSNEIKYAALRTINGVEQFFRKYITDSKNVTDTLEKETIKWKKISQNANSHDDFVGRLAGRIAQYLSNEFGIAVFTVNLFFKHLALSMNNKEKAIIFAPLNKKEIQNLKEQFPNIESLKNINKIRDIKTNEDYISIANGVRSALSPTRIYDWEIDEWNKGK
ncbi:MAG: hypothetical protein SO206_04960 [Bacilli bacterium]|nr:hypothetical protein [Bacilli bacterium]